MKAPDSRLKSLGRHALRGVKEQKEIFALDLGEQAERVTTGATETSHLIGGAYCRPPLFQSAFRPRRILIGEPLPTLRSKISP